MLVFFNKSIYRIFKKFCQKNSKYKRVLKIDFFLTFLRTSRYFVNILKKTCREFLKGDNFIEIF